ncbi:hypothetical protein SDC9_206424 [bioreactor metagenome]|uniref:Uncharacterized protein n=1 Tax=bioreactor metagenome TaxID=1076179 RepID=A0A645J6G6_9ZZZZ
MGALEIVRQSHIHVERGDGVLDAAGFVADPDRVADGLDADLVDRNLAAVDAALYVGNRLSGLAVHVLFSVGVGACCLS